jgi:hypothetical protein
MFDEIRLHEEPIFAFAFATKFATGERSRVMDPEQMQAHF